MLPTFIDLKIFVSSALLLKCCHKKQKNQAAIFKRFSVDTVKKAFNMLVNILSFNF